MKKNNRFKESNPLAHALKLLTIRPRSKEELKKLLLDRSYSIEEINQVIARLSELEYLDDIKFMESWCYYRQHISPKSRWYVKRELLIKGISFDDLEEHFDDFYSEEEELNCLKRIIEKKMSKGNLTGTNSDKKDDQKFVSALLRKGFKLSLILDLLNRLGGKYLDIYEEK
ncbi:MAG: regulatory protein RecX [Dehalobacterium sp.]